MEQSTQPVVTSHVARVARSKSTFLTLEYVGGLASGVLALQSIGVASSGLFNIWNGKLSYADAPLAWLLPVSSGYVGVIAIALTSVVLALLAFLLLTRVSRSLGDRPGYTNRLVYKLATYGTFAVLALQLIVLGVAAVAVVLSSLVLIGSDSSIGALYLQEFLPLVVMSLITGASAYWLYRIVSGVNKSRIWTMALAVIGALVLLATLITVPIAARNGYTSNDFGPVPTVSERSTRSSTSWY